MPKVIFYKDRKGISPIQTFLDNLSAKDARKVTWVLRILEEMRIVPKQYFKNLKIQMKFGKFGYKVPECHIESWDFFTRIIS